MLYRAFSNIRIFFALLFLLWMFLLCVFWVTQHQTKAPHSTLIGMPVPSFELPPIHDINTRGLSSQDLLQPGRVTLLNIWASWCVTCHFEHKYLLELSHNPQINLVSINYRDSPDSARRYLNVYGNPFSAIGYSDKGDDISMLFGIYGVPETFIIKNGIILYKHSGPIDVYFIETLQRHLQ